MSTPRLAIAAALFALFGAACAGHGDTNVAAGAASSSSTAPAASVVTTNTTVTTVVVPTTTPPAPAPAPTAPAPKPVVKPPAAPEPASIEVDYQPHDGANATATLAGPNGSHVKSLDSGAAVFSGLPAGTYEVTITIDTPSGDANIGDARQILKANAVHVEPGEHGVVSCTDEGCAGAL